MIHIRLATKDDASAIEEITRKHVLLKNEPFDEKRFEWGMLRRLYDPLQRHGLFVAEIRTNGEEKVDNKEIMGLIFAEIRIDPFGRSEGHIKQLYVKEPYRHQGIGQQLLNKMIVHLKEMDIKIIKATLKPRSEETFKMYSKLNFKKKYSIMELNFAEESLASDWEEGIRFEQDFKDKNE